MATFDQYSGQLVADGIDTGMPLIPFDNAGVPADLRVLNGVMTKIGKMVFKQPKVFSGPLDGIIKKGGMEFGGASETVQLLTGTPNAKQDGTCIPRGQPTVDAQLNVANFAYSIDVEVKDLLLKKYCNNAQDLASYISMILGSPAKSIGTLKYQVHKELVSNPIDGTRSISSKTKSDGTGSSVTYSATAIKGYAGKVPTPKTYAKSGITISNAKDFLATLEDARDQMMFERTDYTKSGANEFISGTPNIIIEQAFVREMDRVLTGITETHPSSDESATSRLGNLGNVVLIDSFNALPTNVTYAGNVIGASICDPDMFNEDLLNASVESERCVKGRLTGYSYRGESIFYADRGVPGYSLLMDDGIA